MYPSVAVAAAAAEVGVGGLGGAAEDETCGS